jgi:hypothetical protein
MYRKVREILGATMVFYISLIASLGRMEYLYFMESSDRIDGLVRNVAHFCSTYLKAILC